MKRVKTIMLIYEDNSIKGYNLNAFMNILKIRMEDYNGRK